MNMKKCPNCGRKVYSESYVCLYCDYHFKDKKVVKRAQYISKTTNSKNKNEKKSITNKKSLFGIILMIVLLSAVVYFCLPYIVDTTVEVANPQIYQSGEKEDISIGANTIKSDKSFEMEISMQNKKDIICFIECYDKNDKLLSFGASYDEYEPDYTSYQVEIDHNGWQSWGIPQKTKKVHVKILSATTHNVLYDENITKLVKAASISSSTSGSSSSSSTIQSSSSSDYSSVFVKNVLEMYDSDGDGGLSSSEWDYWCSREGYAPMSDCDLNGDGFCSKSELATYSHDFGY